MDSQSRSAAQDRPSFDECGFRPAGTPCECGWEDEQAAATVEQAALRRDGYLLAAHELAEPYPAEIFTPMTDEEIKAAVAAMNEAVPHASERMHAAWARHWSDVLRHKANEEAS